MEAVTSTSTTQAAQASPTTTATEDAASDFETFLTLLTAQMKNQDPLKPLESTDFVAQLASFSSVEQQIKTNETLAAIQNLFGGSPSSGLSDWLGVKVQVQKDPQFSGSPIEIFLAPAENSDRAELVIHDAQDLEIQRISVPTETDVFSWAGKDKNGDIVDAGIYRVSLESFQNNELILSAAAPIYEEVKEARLDAGKTLLVLNDGSVFPSNDVVAVRSK